MPGWLAVLLGGAFGALARYAIALAALRLGATTPWGTFAANMIGCVLIGVALPLAGMLRWSEPVRLLAITGFLGAFTTFSTFSYEAFALWERGETVWAIVYVGGSVVCGLGGVALGYTLGTRLYG